jgi:hypothetical protein
MTPAPEPRRGGVVDGVAGTVLDGAVSVGSADVLDGKADEDEIDGVTLGCAVHEYRAGEPDDSHPDTLGTLAVPAHLNTVRDEPVARR